MKVKADSRSKAYFQAVIDSQLELRGFVAAMLPFYHGDVDDVVQNINAELVRCADEFDTERSFRPWLFRIARTQIARFFREKAAEKLVFSEELVRHFAETCAQNSESDSPLLRRLAQCKRKLSEKHRRMLELRHEMNWDEAKIAAEFGTTRNTVSVTFFRIRKRLYDCMMSLCTMDGKEEFENDAEEKSTPPPLFLLKAL